MNAKQLEYVRLLAREKSFSAAAKKLKISQPALSKQVLALEKELGLPLFDRKASPLALTAAGERFIEESGDLLLRERRLRETMNSYKDGAAGRLVIGTPISRGIYLLPSVIHTFQQRYPKVRVVLHERDLASLRQEVLEGECDFSLVNLPVDDVLFDIVPTKNETMLLAVPDCYAKSLPQTMGVHGYPVVQLTHCADLPFIVLGQQQEIRILFDKFCTSVGVTPHIAVEVHNLTSAWAMVRASIGASLLPLPILESSSVLKGITLFELEGFDYLRQPAVISRSGRQLSEPERYFLELLQQ